MDQPKDKKPLIEALEKFWSEAMAKVSVDDAVKKALQRLRAPSREEVAQLSARLDAISKRIEGLSR